VSNSDTTAISETILVIIAAENSIGAGCHSERLSDRDLRRLRGSE
jgi:hypothetical protein